VSGAGGRTGIEGTESGHRGGRRSLDFRKKTATERLIALSVLDPTLARQRRAAAAKHLAREILRRVDASMCCEVSQAQLARSLGCSVDTVERAQAVLAVNGWLQVERRWIGGHQSCSRYRLLVGFQALDNRKEPLAFWERNNVVPLPDRTEHTEQVSPSGRSTMIRKLRMSMTRKLRDDPVSPSEGETKNDPPSPSPPAPFPQDSAFRIAGAGGVLVHQSPVPESWVEACRRVFPGCHKPHPHLAHLANGLGYTEKDGLAYLRALAAKCSDLPRSDVAAVLACCGRDFRDPSTPAMGGAKSWLERRRKGRAPQPLPPRSVTPDSPPRRASPPSAAAIAFFLKGNAYSTACPNKPRPQAE